jgi:hypothetical protein
LQVFWLKDGEPVDVTADNNYIVSNEGSLIINQARLSDSVTTRVAPSTSPADGSGSLQH